jgi:hypothetical protein
MVPDQKKTKKHDTFMNINIKALKKEVAKLAAQDVKM